MSCRAASYTDGGTAVDAARQLVDVMLDAATGDDSETGGDRMSAVPWDSQLATAAARLLGEAVTCGICQEPIGKEAKQIDHITPRARGGRNDLANLQWSHALCNLWKRDRTSWTAADARAWREAATRPRQCGCGRIIRKRSNSCPVRVKVGACWECHDPCQECPDVWWAQAKCGSCGSSMDDDCAKATLAGNKCARTRERERRERRAREQRARERRARERWVQAQQKRKRKKEQDWERWREQRRPEWERWKQADKAEERQEQNRPARERPEQQEQRPEQERRGQTRRAGPRQPEPVLEREPDEQRQDRQTGRAAAATVVGTDADYVRRADGTGLGRTAREQERARRVRLKWAKRWESIGQHEKARTLRGAR